MLERCKQEIVELHEFFEAWLSGAMPASDDDFARFERALDASFHIINPSGHQLSRDATLELVRHGHGTRPSLKIWIENVAIQQERGDTILITYEEWQSENGDPKGRKSTVVFEDAGDRLVWLHVHESWIER